LLLEVVDPRNFTAGFIICNFFLFSPPNERRGEVGANFGVVGNPIPNFLIAIIEVISISRTVSSHLDNTSKKHGWVTSALHK